MDQNGKEIMTVEELMAKVAMLEKSLKNERINRVTPAVMICLMFVLFYFIIPSRGLNLESEYTGWRQYSDNSPIDVNYKNRMDLDINKLRFDQTESENDSQNISQKIGLSNVWGPEVNVSTEVKNKDGSETLRETRLTISNQERIMRKDFYGSEIFMWERDEESYYETDYGKVEDRNELKLTTNWGGEPALIINGKGESRIFVGFDVEGKPVIKLAGKDGKSREFSLEEDG